MALTIAPAPTGATVSPYFSVKANGVNVPVYVTDGGHFCNYQTDVDVAIQVTFSSTITSNSCFIGKVPSSAITVSGTKISFTLGGANQNGYFSVEVNNSWTAEEDPTKVPLFIFANALEVSVPSSSDPNVKYLANGWWYVDGAGAIQSGTATSTPANFYYDVAQGKTLYLEPGAILKGKVKVGSDSSGGTGVTAATIQGYGIIDARGIPAPDEGRALRVNHSSGVTVNGPTFLSLRNWGVATRLSNNCMLKNFKSFNARVFVSTAYVGTPDGIDITGSHDIDIQNFFSRAYDDACTIKADVPGTTGWNAITYNVRYDGGVVYNAWAGNALEVGFEATNDIHDCYFKNVVVIRKMARNADTYNRDAISIFDDRAGNVYNITFENITVLYCEERFIGIQADSTGDVSNISIKNCVFTQTSKALAIAVTGVSGGTITGVDFNNLQFAGGSTVVASASDITLTTNAFATGITYTLPPPPTPLPLNPPQDVYVRGSGGGAKLKQA